MTPTTFGLEIEMCVNRQRLAEDLAREHGATIKSERCRPRAEGAFVKYYISSGWTVDFEPSLKRWSHVRMDDCTELVTPPLAWGDDAWTAPLALARSMGAATTDACGLHVHVGAESMTAQQAIALLIAVRDNPYREPPALTRRRWCRSLDAVIEAIDAAQPDDLEALREVWWHPKPAPVGRCRHYDTTRQRAVNLQPLWIPSMRTVEFRMFNGTLSEQKIHDALEYVEEIWSLC